MRNIISIVVTCYLGLLLFFPNVGWGLASNVQVFNLYGRGSGVLPLPIVNTILYFLYFVVAIFGYKQPHIYYNFRLRFYFWVFNALFFVFVFYGITTGVTFKETFSSTGLVNVFNMYLFMLVFLKMVSTPEKLEKLGNFIVFCALTRGIWGLVRWAFLGGDPANIYANAQKIAVRITFFDINDSLIATVGVFIAAWQLLYQKPKLSASRKLFYYLMVGVGLAIVLLSYRRTAWGGMVVAGFWFVWQQPWRRRVQVGIVTSLVGALALPVLISERFSTVKGSGGKSGLFYDITSSKGDIETSGGRFSELNLAWKYITESPFTGVMPWGGIGADGSHDFIHSGLLHLWLKGGVLALLCFSLILWSYFLFNLKTRREVSAQDRGMAEAAFAGVLFSLPNLFFGTPFIEFRTSLLLGMLFVLPYLVHGFKKQAKESKLAQPLLKPIFKIKAEPNLS